MYINEYSPRIRHQPWHSTSDVAVDFHNLLNRRWFHQRRRDSLFDRQHDSFRGANADGCRAKFDGFNGIFHLEKPPLRTERVDSTVILGSGQKHLQNQHEKLLTPAKGYVTMTKRFETSFVNYVAYFWNIEKDIPSKLWSGFTKGNYWIALFNE